MMDRETQIAWAAGLFEGEGCFHLRHKKANWRAMLEMTISMTDLDVLERFHAVSEVGGIRPRRARNSAPHWKHQFTWRCSGSAALGLAARIEPYLCSRRKAKLAEIRAAIESSQPQPRQCECCDRLFEPTRFNRERFCSGPCRDRAKYLQRKYGTTSLAQAIGSGYRISIRPERRGHCVHGHELAGDNVLLYTRPSNGRTERRCRQCAHERYIAGTRPETAVMSSDAAGTLPPGTSPSEA